MSVRTFTTETELIEAYASYVIELISETLKTQDRFSLSLSGGSSPIKVFRVWKETYEKAINWSKVDFFFGDERYVPFEDPQNNALMAYNELFRPLGIHEEQIFRINTTLPAETAAADYKETIEQYFGAEPIIFDLIMLGLGDDAHTASLFPGTNVIDEIGINVRAAYLPDNVTRITLSAALINQANNVAFLTFGEKKAEAVKHIFESEFNPTKYPAQLIKPIHGKLEWFLDDASVSLLS